ncbi:UNVERIFIED_CONTAM: hypothetical protein PYX00_003599 [Menopon gallinae]|uniref:Synaptonemal complex protein 3 n=1 Tax=Menopon gallinae TaxID=328185 RepID=A0AAW2I185_9NEOP
MSKSVRKTSLKKCFELDIRSILLSDSSSDENNAKPTKPTKPKAKRQKKEPNSKSTAGSSENRVEKRPDNASNLTNLFEGLKNEIIHKTEVNKDIISRFVQRISVIYKQRFGDLLRRQETEMLDLKKYFADNVSKELENWENYTNSVKKQEEKFVKELEQLRDIYNSSPFKIQKVEMVAKMHKEFIQKYEELMKKHKSEALALKGVVSKEVEGCEKEYLERCQQWKGK